MSQKKNIFSGLFCLLFILACTFFSVNAAADTFHVDLNADTTTSAPRPQDDFYLSVNYDWLKSTKIKAIHQYEASSQDINDHNDDLLQDILHDAVKNRAQYQSTDDAARIADWYTLVLDMDTRNKTGLGGLADLLKQVESASSISDFTKISADLFSQYGFITAFDAVGPQEDPLGSHYYIAYDNGPVLELNKNYFTKDQYASYVKFFQDHVAKVLTLYGIDEKTAASDAEKIVAMEKDVYSHSLDISASNDPTTFYKTVSYDELKALHTNLDLDVLLSAVHMTPADGVTSWMITDPDQIKSIDTYYTEENLPWLKDYQIYKILNAYSTEINQEYETESLAFGRAMNGNTEDDTPEKRAYDATSAIFADAFGRIYSGKYCSDKTVTEMTSMIHKVLDQYKVVVTNLDWMQPETKAEAIKKLDTMTINVGYPKKYADVNYLNGFAVTMPADGGTLIGNQLAFDQLKNKYGYSLLGKPVDSEIWSGMEPHTVNAFYDPTHNSINFPAGFLWAPYFDPDAAEETNFGGIGIVIAHEITHSFDIAGSQYDETGKLHNWWTETDRTEFLKRTKAISEFYSRYEIGDNGHLDGEQTLTENIADLGAVQCLTAIVGKDNKEGLKKLYTNFAVASQMKVVPEFVQYLLAMDVHSLFYVRVDGTMSNTDGFYTAFDIKEGDGMYVAPEDRVKLW